MTSTLSPVRFDPPLQNPAQLGLFSATSWTEASQDDALRWLGPGVEIRPWNYGLTAFGVWQASWLAAQSDLGDDDVKQGVRPTGLAAFAPITVWAADSTDMTSPQRDEARTRAAQTLRIMEQPAVESHFAERLLDDAGTPGTAATLVAAVSQLEELWAASNTQPGFIHARPGWAALAAQAQLLVRGGLGLTTPLGLRWVFGAGYVDGGLADTLVVTSPTFGWRVEPVVRAGEDPKYQNRFYAIAERSLAVGYEALIGAVTVVPE